METPRIDVKEILDELHTTRDELHLQMHLAAAEVRDEWTVLEKKYEHFRSRAELVHHEVAVDDIPARQGAIGGGSQGKALVP